MSTRDAGTTIRASSSALLTIDSEDRFASYTEKRQSVKGGYNNNPYDFTLIRDAPLVNGYMTRLALTEVQFPFVYPNINGRTNTINISYIPAGGVGTTTVLFLPVGFYTPAELAIEMYNAINAIDNTILNGFSYGTGNLPRFSYTPNAGCSIGFLPMAINQQYSPVPGVIPPTNVFPYPNTTKQLFDVLGFSVDNIAPSSVLTFGQATLAQSIRYLDIVSPQLTANQGLPDSTSQAVGHSALCRLYIGGQTDYLAVPGAPADVFAPPGTSPFVIYRQFQTPKQVAWNAFMPISGRIQFQVYDDDGQLLTATETANVVTGAGTVLSTYDAYTDWSITLLITEN